MGMILYWGLSMLDAQQLETAGFGSKTALRRFLFESPKGDFADGARNFSCRICSIDKPYTVRETFVCSLVV